MLNSDEISAILKARSRSMPRQKYQRPTVYPAGSREKLWKAEWREYFTGTDDKQSSRHRSKTWSRATHTKAQAQEALDALLRAEKEGPPKADGSITLIAFWDDIYYPIRIARWNTNTRRQAECFWRNHISPALGKLRLTDITKSSIELLLAKTAVGFGKAVVRGVLTRTHSILEEATDNDFIPRNPARKIHLPECRQPKGTRSLTVAEVHRLFETTTGRDYLMWRCMVMTGARPSEMLALTRSDLTPGGLLIDESSIDGKPAPTKNRKARNAPLPESLREEIEEWLSSHDHQLMFPTPRGLMHRRSDYHMMAMEERARVSAKIPDLTFRMCRTTFASLFEGDEADRTGIMGHHSPAFTLEVYRKPVTERQRGSVEALDRRLHVVPKVQKSKLG
jgi:integrase